ncbi:MAG: hypothetical protein MZW92_78805 [Comamonadaceae bacterium]|nr:hypothetical protein [Comamonadaceae bacterium]
MAFWGAWGTETTTLILQCRDEGNAELVAFCKQQHPNGFAVQVPLHQGIFVHDIQTGQTRAVAKAPGDFDDFVLLELLGPRSRHGQKETTTANWRAGAPRASWPFPGWLTGA